MSAVERPAGEGSAAPYEVFSRHSSEDVPHHLGQVRATTDDDAVVYAWTLYDERKWKDLFIVPRSAMTQLIEPE
ncbi:hypothetical protein [Euzebya sp.]|uniref:hypothetical protein n=1 Tax=Euzebya sp. TaxID=1971409 RepID=UPI00351676E3